ncbi:UTP--glucose-1-phosphate uridylyltransferase isoform X8 [Gossypium hirsutum]|uniref:UTP--glucose-1-phosphate uridylyltransferase n=1 Tax=Gossypium hirsutum TaxID=3635 RepID=A0A1U8K406_GOSHI|nr:UTP--glucose-1-phosphate uridylyltransferase isoform X8 [Gossypium hirsutum]XP_016695339.1 UTP--glucose-1-phosphate uridylyltransferase isoform X8 [Gossypium hirsutum]XP_016695345.1 UTP--glucose-1-phosphate uridylyltransferase isoform X8 [Gossypium hirsutum]XP_016695354.1 UTP--glucose-1-phosphate uridylyltransferase isoform X8 [Gossypium hirsutum]
MVINFFCLVCTCPRLLFTLDRDQIESTSESECSVSDEVLVVPYDNLAPMSCADITESKQLLDKLVVVKYNGALGKNMGFGGPEWGLENTIKGKTSDMVIPSQAVAS